MLHLVDGLPLVHLRDAVFDGPREAAVRCVNVDGHRVTFDLRTSVAVHIGALEVMDDLVAALRLVRVVDTERHSFVFSAQHEKVVGNIAVLSLHAVVVGAIKFRSREILLLSRDR